MSLQGYAAFSDESRHTASRYRSIAVVSLPAADVMECNHRIAALLKRAGVREFKWNRLNGAKKRFCALALIQFLFQEMIPARARVDVLTWDTRDSRHAIARRDDRKNFERMFYHLHNAVLRRREAGAVWHIRPDERLDIDWKTLEEVLESAGSWSSPPPIPLLCEKPSGAYRIGSFREVKSSEMPLSQVADLFAGAASYARDRSDIVRGWLEEKEGQLSFVAREEARTSGTDGERCLVVGRLYERCRRHRLGVSLRSEGFFRTRDPSGPINFWNYEPQHDADQAPTLDS